MFDFPTIQLNTSEFIDSIIAVGTLAAVTVALFQERIKSRLNKAKLDVDIRLNPPDSQKIETHIPDRESSNLETVWVRIRVTHLKGKAAENVEVMLAECHEVGSGKRVKMRENFIPMNLLWAHKGGTSRRIPRHLFRHCDLGFLFSNDAGPHFKLQTEVSPNPTGDDQKFPVILEAGTYDFLVLVSGDNVETVRQWWRFKVPDEWASTEKKLLKSMSARKLKR